MKDSSNFHPYYYGLGGAGSRIVGELYRTRCTLNAMVVDTDERDLMSNPCATKRAFAEEVFNGGGSAGNADNVYEEAGRRESWIEDCLKDCSLAVFVSSTAGGTGSGLLPAFLNVAERLSIPCISVEVSPFAFENGAGAQPETRRRFRTPTRNVLRIPFDSQNVGKMMTRPDLASGSLLGTLALPDIYANINQRIVDGISLFAKLQSMQSFLRLSDADVLELVRRGAGVVHFGASTDRGAKRAENVARNITDQIGKELTGAKQILVGICAGSDLLLEELEEIRRRLGTAANDFMAPMRFAVVIDPRMPDNALSCVTFAFPEWKSDVLDPTEIDKNFRSPFEAGSGFIWNGEDLDIPAFRRKGIIIRSVDN